MLDGKHYFGAFPDEKPETDRLRSLLDALRKLEHEFRRHFEECGIDTGHREESNNPDFRKS